MSKNALIIFQKNAVLGKVKTRLAVSIGDHQAMQVYDWLTTRTHQIVKEVEAEKFLYYSDFNPEKELESTQNYNFEVQTGADLGERMSNSFVNLFAKEFQRIVIIGTDCPDLTAEHIEMAFRALDSNDLVLGPAKDGGYYLLGTNQFYPDLFTDIPWSTGIVLKLTLEKAALLNLSYELLEVLSDIDTLEDWQEFTTRNQITP